MALFERNIYYWRDPFFMEPWLWKKGYIQQNINWWTPDFCPSTVCDMSFCKVAIFAFVELSKLSWCQFRWPRTSCGTTWRTITTWHTLKLRGESENRLRLGCRNYPERTDGTKWVFPKIMGKPPKSSILIGFSIINHPFWGYHYFWKHPYRMLL